MASALWRSPSHLRSPQYRLLTRPAVIHAYIVEHDIGFAPNPFFGYCTVACCKPRIRGNAQLGSWLVGIGSKNDGIRGKLVYAMQVEERITFDQYWCDERFQCKVPNYYGSLKQAQGDNIYRQDGDGNWIQSESRHTHSDPQMTLKHIGRDTSENRVLVSTRFAYLGQNARNIPDHFRDYDGKPLSLGPEKTPKGGLRRECDFEDPALEALLTGWLSAENLWGYQGDPVEWRKATSIRGMLAESY